MRIAELTEPDLSPDGEYVVYSVGSANSPDKTHSDLWRVSWDGRTGAS